MTEIEESELRAAIGVLLNDEKIGDFVYHVRESAMSDGTFAGNAWDHPRVTKFCKAVDKLERFIQGASSHR